MAILELMQPNADRDMDWLMEALQAAVELEFFTLPPYLTAMWSIKDETHYAAQTIREVVYEEMQHMALACNMLVAVGGTPRINRSLSIPQYPRPLPGGVKPDLIVELSGLSAETLKTFMLVEEPKEILQFEEGFEGFRETFPRIGAFYEAVQETFDQLQPPLCVDRQIAGPLAPLIIANQKDVKTAIDLIRRQGEGSGVSPADESPQDLAHFYRFQEIEKLKKLEYNVVTKKYRWGKAFSFPDVYPVASVPAGGYRYEEVAVAVGEPLQQFDNAYTNMLDELQLAWERDGQAALWRAVEHMFSLKSAARLVMAMPIPGTQKNYAPNFRYLFK